MQWASEVQKTRHQRAETVGLRRNIAGEFGSQRIRIRQLLCEHLRGPFDDSKRIANLVRQTRRQLAQRRQTLRSPGLSLCLLQSPVGLGQRLSSDLIALRLPAYLRDKPVHQHRRQEEEKNA